MEPQRAQITADSQVARIFEWRRGFNTIYLIHLGVQLGLFRALNEAPGSSAAQLAARLGLHAPYVERWCLTAYGMELLDAEGEGYRLAPFMDVILAAPSHPRYLGGYAQLAAEVAADDFMRCLDAFRTGNVIPFQGRGDAFNQAIAGSTWGLQVVTAKKILPGLPGLSDRLGTGGRVLEVGCGTGNLLVQLAKAFPAAQVVGVDIETESVATARRRVQDAGVGDRVEVCLGTVADAARAGQFDTALMVEVLHEIAADIRPAVVAESARALKPGGWMVIVDETYPQTLDEARRPEFKFPLHTGFEEMLWGNVIPTRAEQERLLRDAGLTGRIERSLIGEGFTVLATQKAA
ncbi:MAG TPA: class I SAM-dependent methyltransferase [Burkholderiales bacterium]|nr:class I SAM-dependent methyltransferase [Burkholderiales bacterium]